MEPPRMIVSVMLSRGMLAKLYEDHPHMNFIMNEDSFASNAPHIGDLKEYGYRCILGAKEGDHKFLFKFVGQAVETGEAIKVLNLYEKEGDISHCFRIVYNTPLNKSNQDLNVTFVEYWEDNPRKKKVLRFSWITDLNITADNVYKFMRGARAKWKIESEIFNALINQGYQFGDNFCLGEKHLSEVFVLLMMQAFPRLFTQHHGGFVSLYIGP